MHSCKVSDILSETCAAAFSALVGGSPLSDAVRGDQSRLRPQHGGGRWPGEPMGAEKSKTSEAERLVSSVSFTWNRGRTALQHPIRLLNSLIMQIVRHDPRSSTRFGTLWARHRKSVALSGRCRNLNDARPESSSELWRQCLISFRGRRLPCRWRPIPSTSRRTVRGGARRSSPSPPRGWPRRRRSRRW